MATSADDLSGLASPDPLVRLDTARSLISIADERHRRAVLAALSIEDDPWVRRALGRVLRGKDTTPIRRRRGANPELSDGAKADELRAEAVEEITKLLLHEIRPIVGSIRMRATKEFADFESSDTRRGVDRLTDLLESIGALSRAATAPRIVDDFDLADLMDGLVVSEIGGECDPSRVLGGPRPQPVVGSKSLVDLALRNGLRNAVESVAGVGRDPCGSVVLNWGATDTEYWASIIDEGEGLPEAFDRLFDIGVSSRKTETNFGMGLAIARRAARTLGGDVVLLPRERVGATYQLRWPRPS